MIEKAIVQTYIDTLAVSPNATDDQLSELLQQAGLEIDQAERAIAFVPTAFARVALKGATFSAGFEIRDPETGRCVRGRFSEEPIFVEALARAEELGPSAPRVDQIAARSAEMGVVKQLGGHAHEIAFTEPILMRIPPSSVSDKKPWWRLW